MSEQESTPEVPERIIDNLKFLILVQPPVEMLPDELVVSVFELCHPTEDDYSPYVGCKKFPLTYAPAGERLPSRTRGYGQSSTSANTARVNGI
jgi:hypothetical protein